jgi:protein required for attachment to host cells
VKTRAWIVLADSASARLYEMEGLHGNWTLVGELAHPRSRALQQWELDGHGPARVKQTRGELEKFSVELAKALEHGLARRAYEQLVLVAPSAFLGILREKLSPRVLARIANVVERDYLHMDERKARQRLEEQLQAH